MERNEFIKRYTDARRKVISRDFGSLNDMQLKAVTSTEGPLLLLAGAGSGKTTVLINRIANLIKYGCGSDSMEVPQSATENDLLSLEAAAESGKITDHVRSLCAMYPAEPWRILAITFTNKAADELKSRLTARLGPQAQDIWAMTFHSACVRILRRTIDRLGYDKSFTIYDDSDSQSIIKRILKELELDEKVFPPRTVMGYISRAKDALQSASDFTENASKGHDPRLKHIAQVYTEYQKRLKAANAVDFDDLIYLTVRILTEHKDIRDYYQRYFRYVLVDEYQDTSLLQYRLVSTLAGGWGNICVVGDDDQSIYKFRGATIENILSFENTYKNARSIKLEQNYRSTGHILAAANAVIRNNKGRKGKELWTSLGDGEKPRLHIAQTDDDEASYIAARILGGVAEGFKWSDFAILYRMNAQSNRLEYAFKRNAIPYKVVGGMRFFERAEIKDMTSYLCVVHNPADDLRLLRIINTPARGIGATTIDHLRDIAAQENRPIMDIIRDSASYKDLSRASAKLLSFAELISQLQEASTVQTLDEFYDALLDRTGYILALGTNDEALSRIDNIKELKSNIISYTERAEQPSLAGFLDEIALYTDLDSLNAGDEAVTMMTMHAAKGLEFPWVFVVGMEDGIFPSSRSIGEEEEMEEERRLCYVALTRAKKHLTLTAAQRRMLFGRTSANMLSRFVDEIPSDHIERPPAKPYGGFGDPDPEFLEYSRWEDNEGYGYASRPDRGYGQRSSYGSTYSGYSRERSGYGGSSGYGSRDKSRGSGPVTSRSAPQKSAPAPKPQPPKETAPLMELNVGDHVEHKAFGAGVVTGCTPVAGDALITIKFDAVGDKRLMLKTAGAFMKKTD